MPVLSNILLEAKGNQLRLAATNREIAINCWIGAKVEDGGAITVSARLLSEFVNSLPPDRIDMELTVRTQTLHLSCARFEANMKGIDAFEFPLIVPAEQIIETSGDTITQAMLPVTQMRKMIDQTTFAASADENRPTLTGVEVTLSPDCVKMAATDGYRLSVRTIPIEGGPEKTTVIVPAKSLGELARISADAAAGEPVQCLITPQRNQVMFVLTGNGIISRVELVSELIDARFPDYMATVPKSYNTRTTVDTAALLKAVRVALLFARDNANIVAFSVDPTEQKLHLAATGAEMGDNASDIECAADGPPVEILYNAKYLIDYLSQVDTPQVVMETTTPTRPGLFRLVGADGYIHCVMPLHPPK
jgi:DNA polymerase-3 subunit beta